MNRSGRLVLATLVLVLLTSTPCGAADLLIRNATVVAVQSASLLGSRNVLVRDGRIASISDKPVMAAGVAALDARGRFLVPGIMDSHVHLSNAAGLPATTDNLDVASLRAQYFRQQPRSYLYFGVTQVLDIGNFDGGTEIFSSQPQHPDQFRCNTVLLPGELQTAASESQANLIQDPTGTIANEHSVDSVMTRIASANAQCVSLLLEDIVGDRTNSAALLKRVVDAAHRQRLLVLAHTSSLDAQVKAVAAGVDVLAQGLWNWNGQTATTGLPTSLTEHLRKVRERQVGVQSTLRALYSQADLFRQDTLLDPSYTTVVPLPVLTWYRTDAGQWFRHQPKSRSNNLADTRLMQMQFIAGERGMRVVKNLADEQYPLLPGSDTSGLPTYGSQPGYDTYREMRALAQAGVPMAAILQAATINNARQFRLERDYGSVDIGKVANLLLLDANPLESVRAWSQIDKIVLRGSVIERESLAAGRQ